MIIYAIVDDLALIINEVLPKNLFKIPTAFGGEFEIVSEVICLVNSSNNIPVFLYLECLGFMHEYFYSYINM